VHGGLDSNRECTPAIGQKQIHQKIQQLNFRDCHAKISQVDSQLTLENGVVVQVNYINFKLELLLNICNYIFIFDYDIGIWRTI